MWRFLRTHPGSEDVDVMRTLKIIAGTAFLLMMLSASWQVGSAIVANMNFQEEIRDLASQGGTRVGLLAPSSDDDMIQNVVGKAHEHGIDLQPAQVTVRRTGAGVESRLSLAADYHAPVNLLLFSFNLHFAPSSVT